MNQQEFQSTILRYVRAMREETRLSLVGIQNDLEETKQNVMAINERLDSITGGRISNTVRKPPQSMTGRDVNVAFWVHKQIEKVNAKITTGKKLLMFDDDIPWDILNGDAKRCVGALMALHLNPGWESLTWATIYRTQPRNAERVVEAAGRKPEMAVFAQCSYNWGIRAICEQKQKSNKRTATKGKNGQRFHAGVQKQINQQEQGAVDIQQPQIDETTGHPCSRAQAQIFESGNLRNSTNEILPDAAANGPVEITSSFPNAINETKQAGRNQLDVMVVEGIRPSATEMHSHVNQTTQDPSSTLPTNVPTITQDELSVRNVIKNPRQEHPVKSSGFRSVPQVAPEQHIPFKSGNDSNGAHNSHLNGESLSNLGNSAIIAARRALDKGIVDARANVTKENVPEVEVRRNSRFGIEQFQDTLSDRGAWNQNNPNRNNSGSLHAQRGTSASISSCQQVISQPLPRILPPVRGDALMCNGNTEKCSTSLIREDAEVATNLLSAGLNQDVFNKTKESSLRLSNCISDQDMQLVSARERAPVPVADPFPHLQSLCPSSQSFGVSGQNVHIATGTGTSSHSVRSKIGSGTTVTASDRFSTGPNQSSFGVKSASHRGDFSTNADLRGGISRKTLFRRGRGRKRGNLNGRERSRGRGRL